MRILDFTLSPQEAADPGLWQQILCKAAQTAETPCARILRESIDARSRQGVRILRTVAVFAPGEQDPAAGQTQFAYRDVHAGRPVVVVGSGPAGLFAALRLIEHGLRPVILERGKDVGERKKDIATLSRGLGLNAESNYCFGWGGAGTFSDGKLFTRSSKRGDTGRILARFRFHGADEKILYQAHPHIGSDKLPDIVRHMYATITGCGGDVVFGARVTDLRFADGRIQGVFSEKTGWISADTVVWATGHSAHDAYEMLRRKGLALECKPFAMGVRVEHPQDLIDEIQYHRDPGMAYLPAATYALTAQAGGRGVYSFCMCPGGFMVAAASSSEGQVVNGMSSSRRHTPYANAGIITEVREEDLKDFAAEGPLAGLRYQQAVEHLAMLNGGGGQTAPAARLTDFVAGRLSGSLPENSYMPGLIPSPLHFWLPEDVSARLREGFREFDRKMHGFLTREAVVVGVESRSSSPVRIPREAGSLQHVQVAGLYPCGEGAGYAGGITSSAMDGENVADRIAATL